MKILREEDPAGTLLRKSRYIKQRVYTCHGSNHTWHADSNNKLKPYGFPLHGCIDGFLRKGLWLKLTRSNNTPAVPASYFLKIVSKLNLVPDILRIDYENENCFLAGIQCKLANNTDAHRYGSTIHNQRIENCWSHFKWISLSWAIDFFKDLVATGSLILGNIVQMECLWFVFSPLIQCKLDRLMEEWSAQKSRNSNHSLVPGSPDELYLFPESLGYEQCRKNVPMAEINELANESNVHLDF